MLINPKRTLIIQGGGFRTGFSTGVLDAFLMSDYLDFDFLIGNSGGAIALSYFLSHQYKKCFDAMCLLAEDKNFISYNKLISQAGMMNVDYFHHVAEKLIPFHLGKAVEEALTKRVVFILTAIETGNATYFEPSRDNWMDVVIASCTLPFVTKGSHTLDGKEYMDGGWSDGLPVEWAYNQGAREIIIVRTLPPDLKLTQSWSDYFGSLVFRSNDPLRACFENNHLIYNKSIDFINHPPADLKIQQIAPDTPLRAGTYSNSVSAITDDYRRGLDYGLQFVKAQQSTNFTL